MLNINAKQKMNAAIQHVKNHPTAYAVGLTLAACTITRYVYDTKKGLVYMSDVVKEMTDTGKGMYFTQTKTGVTVIAALWNPETMKDITFLD